MNLGIVGTGVMGSVLFDYAVEEGTFKDIFLIEPKEENSWPEERMDLLIDFSHPAAMKGIYAYCRRQGGTIPVVLATTGSVSYTHLSLHSMDFKKKTNRKL